MHQNNSSEEMFNPTSINHYSNETENDRDNVPPNVPASSKIFVNQNHIAQFEA